MNVRRLRCSAPAVRVGRDHTGSIEHTRGMLGRCASGSGWQPVLAARLGQLYAESGADLHLLLSCVDETLTAAGRGPATARVACAALEAWTQERARLGLGADDPLTGLPGADHLHRRLGKEAVGLTHRVLVAEVIVDGRSSASRGKVERLEAELSLALVRAVLDDGLAGASPSLVPEWSRLGEHRLGAVVEHAGAGGLVAAVGRARRWLAHWRDDLEVSAWFEPVPADPGACGALVRDLAM